MILDILPLAGGTARLVRVYGGEPCVKLPGAVPAPEGEGQWPITELGDYCFSEKPRGLPGPEKICRYERAEDGSRVALLRFGRANSQLLIERDRRNLCHYETEVGSLTLGVTGDGIDCKLTEKGGSAAFSYLLDADDARIVSRNTLEMTVQRVN